MKRFAAIIGACLLYPLSVMATPQAVTDVSQLDFEGDFAYAINFDSWFPTQVIGDATFSRVNSAGAGAPAGFSISGFNQNLSWGGASSLGGSADNNSLEAVMSTIIWASGINPGNINLSVETGESYRLQLLFSEGCCNNRHYDVSIENGAFTDTVLGTAMGGTVWKSSTTQAYAMVWEFVAQDPTVNIQLSRPNPQSGDTNYHISGLTLEKGSDAGGIFNAYVSAVEQNGGSDGSSGSAAASSSSPLFLLLMGMFPVLRLFRGRK